MSNDVTVLPDGSAFDIWSTGLPKDHWLYADKWDVPPMGLRCGKDNPLRRELKEMVLEAAKYAVRAATMNGTEEDFDPDALCQRMVIGMLGYVTPDALGNDQDIEENPNPIPCEITDICREKGAE